MSNRSFGASSRGLTNDLSVLTCPDKNLDDPKLLESSVESDSPHYKLGTNSTKYCNETIQENLSKISNVVQRLDADKIQTRRQAVNDLRILIHETISGGGLQELKKNILPHFSTGSLEQRERLKPFASELFNSEMNQIAAEFNYPEVRLIKSAENIYAGFPIAGFINQHNEQAVNRLMQVVNEYPHSLPAISTLAHELVTSGRCAPINQKELESRFSLYINSVDSELKKAIDDGSIQISPPSLSLLLNKEVKENTNALSFAKSIASKSHLDHECGKKFIESGFSNELSTNPNLPPSVYSERD